MHRILSLRALVAAAALVVAGLSVQSAQAQDFCGAAPPQGLFYNYYAAPVPCSVYGGVGAQLYISPLPAPPLVGYTYITYPPLMPHEFLYQHSRVYYRPAGPYAGPTVTKVTWH